MTAPSRARRHAANVEVMRLDTREDIVTARRWLNAHGVETAECCHGPHCGLLWIGPTDGIHQRTTARLGQVLTFDPDLRVFDVLDAAVYDKTHTAAQGDVE